MIAHAKAALSQQPLKSTIEVDAGETAELVEDVNDAVEDGTEVIGRNVYKETVLRLGEDELGTIGAEEERLMLEEEAPGVSVGAEVEF